MYLEVLLKQKWMCFDDMKCLKRLSPGNATVQDKILPMNTHDWLEHKMVEQLTVKKIK